MNNFQMIKNSILINNKILKKKEKQYIHIIQNIRKIDIRVNLD